MQLGFPVTGTRFGPYEIIDQLGAGGMGEVYGARDTRLHHTVAIKVLVMEYVPPRAGVEHSNQDATSPVAVAFRAGREVGRAFRFLRTARFVVHAIDKRKVTRYIDRSEDSEFCP